MMFPSVFISGGRVEAEFQEVRTSATDASSYTFTSVPFGAAHTRRYVVVYAHVRTAGGTTAADSLSIGGIAATTVSSGTGLYFWVASVPTGASGSIVVGAIGPRLGCEIAVWSVKLLRSTTPVATATNFVIGSPTSITINTTSGGCVLGASIGQPSISWTNLTEDDEIAFEGGSNISVATHAVTATETRTVTIATSGSGVPIMRLISLR